MRGDDTIRQTQDDGLKEVKGKIHPDPPLRKEGMKRKGKMPLLQFRKHDGLKMTEIMMTELIRSQWSLMGRIEHITTQQIIGEWGSIENFAASHGVSPASTKMVIYVDGAKSRPVEEVLRKYGYLNLLRFEKELRKRGQTFSGYVATDGLNPVELIETLRMKESHPDVVTGLKKNGFWAVLEKGGEDTVPSPQRGRRTG